MEKQYVGNDLHSNNNVISIIDSENKPVLGNSSANRKQDHLSDLFGERSGGVRFGKTVWQLDSRGGKPGQGMAQMLFWGIV